MSENKFTPGPWVAAIDKAMPASQAIPTTQPETITEALIPPQATFQPIAVNHVKVAGNGLGARKNGNVKKRGPGVQWTPETARAARYKAIANAKHAKELQAQVDRDVSLKANQLALERADMLAKQIRRTCEELEAFVGTKDRAQLLTALSRLIDQERVLRGIPNPGSYRPSKPRSESQSSDATPL